MRKLILATTAALALCAAPMAHAADAAPDPVKVALVKRYFAAMHINQMMSGMMKQMAPALMAQAKAQHSEITEAQTQAVTDAMTETMDDFVPKLTDAMIPLYADVFTTEELTRLDEFYESPIGQSIVAKMPAATQKMVPVMMQMMPDLQADMMKHLCAKIDCTAKKAGA
jgi:hypothetical protein